MTIKEIIAGLKFTVDMFLFDASTGETYAEPRNDMDKTTVDACKGAIEFLEQARWIPCSEKLPESYKDVLVYYEYYKYCDYGSVCFQTYGIGYCSVDGTWHGDVSGSKAKCLAWMPLPKPYKGED